MLEKIQTLKGRRIKITLRFWIETGDAKVVLESLESMNLWYVYVCGRGGGRERENIN